MIVQVAQALVGAGYLSDADVDAAATILADVMVAEADREAEAEASATAALVDGAYQEGLSAQADYLSTQDATRGDYVAEELDYDTRVAAEAELRRDQTVVADAEAAILSVYYDAATALVAAGLIRNASVDDVARVIADAVVSAEFRLELRPQPIAAGDPAMVVVENRTHELRMVTVSYESRNNDLSFEPDLPRALPVPPGEVATAEFSAVPRKRPVFGGQVLYPFTSRVQSGATSQSLRGEVVGKALIPSWLALVGLVALLACCCISGLAAIYVGSLDAPTPTLTPTMTLSEVATPTAGDLWQQIQESGRIVVGTSVDYPPFEFYTDDNRVDGFDIALMDEIGRRLGLQTEYLDYAFDGLGPALRLGEIHVAVAAISRTPEREAVVDFSNVYLVSEDGVLAREDANLAIGSVDDAAQYRIGVQRNSVYEAWIQLVLIDAGRMSADNLFAYEKAEHAIRDLRDGRIDLVFLDVQPAQAFVEEGGVKLVAKGLNPQNYAIALPKGESTLKTELDQVITALYNDGTIANLAQQYLGLPQVLPTSMPEPTSTTAPAPECENGLSFIQDLTQAGDLEPGQAFTKGWQVQNSGTCAWNTGYRLVSVGGDSMGGEPAAVARDVQPGEPYDLQINLITPLNPGDYQGFWQMVDDEGIAFGERLQVYVKVTSDPTVTPQPTQTPVAGISFTVDRNIIKAGECVNFAWKVDNVQDVYFYKEGESWEENGVVGEGTQVECPPATATYYLRVVLRDNSVEVREISVYVEQAADAPSISRFTVDPAGQVTLGQCVTLRWEVEGALEDVTLSANDVPFWSGAPASGSYQDCPAETGSMAYVIEAAGPGGTSRGQQNISVVDSATATPEATAAPELPLIYTFVVTPAEIPAGECVGISWSVGGGTTYSQITRNGMVLIEDAAYNGQQMDCPDAVESYTYQLEAFSATGEIVTQAQSVIVTEAAE